ncbi:hypothetical protein CCHL11_06463 [Colletotrichum chlorophyti]|uniref:Uncharacterized protein n=1 Tax=Colletotrichum chlorophyti TaxID=708187 RepID=A0A1Q8RRT5_9PEZI|nr:hypothetical protein CCHL11_06463 [Colletotrichum chlorophyti]
MHPLSIVLLFASSAAALPATPAPPTATPVPRFRPTGTLPTNTDPTPSPIYSTIIPSNATAVSNSTSSLPCASRRPLRLGPARLHKKPLPTSSALAQETTNPTTTVFVVVAAAAAAASAAEPPIETPTDSGPRDYASLIPPAPGVTPRPEPNLAEMGYYQTTYYSCATRGTSVHCGWHRPIMVAPANAAADHKARAGAGAIFFAGIVGVLMLG